MCPRAASPPKSTSMPSLRSAPPTGRAEPSRRRRCSRCSRDFAFIVPEGVSADGLLRAIRGADKAAITSARLFDRFDAPEGLSLAFEVTLQPVEKSFTEEQIAEVSQRIVAAAEKLGARLRS